MEALWIGTPNKERGRRGYRPEAIVIHIMDGALEGSDSWFRDPASRVSAHYGVRSTGEVHQYVAEMDTAWHAGRRSEPSWKLIKARVSPNLYTLGIEHEGRADTAWSAAMLEASARLVAEICNRWSIPVDRDHVIGHRETYARKDCPGRWIDLDRYITRVRGHALAAQTYNFIEHAGTVRARVDLNIRIGAATTLAPVVKTVSRDSVLEYVGWTSNGLSVHGNAHWYKGDDGNFFWAGATDRPIPGAPR
jgi:N-acetylmuramoyl-L-alanine amidase